MSGLPNTQVFLDDGTGTFPKEVTKYARLTDGYQFSRGRADTQSAVTAGILTLTFNNKTGAFTPGSTYLGSPSLIKLDTPIRIKETVNGVTYNRFTGFVKSWVVGWPDGTEDTAKVTITASDAQARAERRVLRSVVEEEILADVPSAMYVLGEPASATAAGVDTSGGQQPNLVQTGSGTPVAFGATSGGPTTDGQTAATFAGGKYLSALQTFASTPSTVAIGIYFSGTVTGPIARVVAGDPFTITPTLALAAGRVVVTDSATTLQSGTGFDDGAVHDALAIFTAGGCTLYADGALVGTTAALGITLAQQMTFEVGGVARQHVLGPLASAASTFTGTLAGARVFTSAPSAGRALSQATAGRTGFAGESGTARLTRLAGYAGIATGTLDTSLTNVPFVEITDQTAWAGVQDACDAEMGVAYINGSGTLDFHNRQKVTTKSSPDLTLASSFVTFDAEPTTDDQDLLNYLETKSSVTDISQVVRSTSSETSHGRYSDSKIYTVSTDAEALDRANWLVKTRAEPATSGRYGTLTVNLYGMSAAQQSATVAALEHGCWLRVVSMPTQTTGGTTVDVVVEGIAPVQNSQAWQIVCNVVSKTALYPKVFILDTSVLDGPDLLAV